MPVRACWLKVWLSSSLFLLIFYLVFISMVEQRYGIFHCNFSWFVCFSFHSVSFCFTYFWCIFLVRGWKSKLSTCLHLSYWGEGIPRYCQVNIKFLTVVGLLLHDLCYWGVEVPKAPVCLLLSTFQMLLAYFIGCPGFLAMLSEKNRESTDAPCLWPMRWLCPNNS